MVISKTIDIKNSRILVIAPIICVPKRVFSRFIEPLVKIGRTDQGSRKLVDVQ
jgi:hypothetical protein